MPHSDLPSNHHDLDELLLNLSEQGFRIGRKKLSGLLNRRWTIEVDSCSTTQLASIIVKRIPVYRRKQRRNDGLATLSGRVRDWEKAGLVAVLDLGGQQSTDRPVSSTPDACLYTDGACIGNPGPGGWAYILKSPKSHKRKQAHGAESATTNNRMELLAVIKGLEALTRPAPVRVCSDSQYVLKGLESWLDMWVAKNWRTTSKKPVLNRDLWERLLELRHHHSITVEWIKGHSGHPENEECDQLAYNAALALMHLSSRGR